MQWEDVVGWYLEKKEDDLQTEEDLNAEEAIVNKVRCFFVFSFLPVCGALMLHEFY